MENKPDSTGKKQDYYWLYPTAFKKGQSGNPKGRPKGSKSIKDAVRQYLKRNPTEFTDFVAHFVKENRELAWQMLEGKPQQDITTAGEKVNNQVLVKFVDGNTRETTKDDRDTD